MSQWPSSKARQVLAALLRIGWAMKRQVGSHRLLAREGWADYLFAFHDGGSENACADCETHRIASRGPLGQSQQAAADRRAGSTVSANRNMTHAQLAAGGRPLAGQPACPIPNMNDFIEPQTVARLLADVRCRWGVAGGWALDLFLDRVTRKHQDIEVAIFREDQLILQEDLSCRGWSFEYVRNGQLFPWQIGERLELPFHEIWCRIRNGSLRFLEVLLNERRANAFVFRRDARVGAPIDRTFVRSNSGIPVLAPEIVLLYKSKRALESKEQLDFSNMFNALDKERRKWLFESVTVTDPEHAWLAALASPDSTQAS